MPDSAASPPRASPLRRWWPLLLALLPSLYYVVELPDFAALPYNDYYEVLYDITDESGFRSDLRSWLTIRSNEHRVTLPALIYWANYQLTGGDNRGHSVVTLLFILGSLVLLLRWLARTLPEATSPSLRAPIVLTIGILLFNPVQGHNVTMGFSGVMWLLSNLLAIASLTALIYHPKDRVAGSTAAILGIGGALSYSSNLMLWPVLAVACFLRRMPRRRWLPVAVAGFSVFLFYFGTFDKPASSPTYQIDPVTIVRFTCTYLGALFTGTTRIASLIGGFGVLAFLSISLLHLKERRARTQTPPGIQPWLLLALYSLGNALGTSVGRAALTDDGIQTAFASRYANVSCLFWIGTLVAASRFLVKDSSLSDGWRRILAVSGSLLLLAGTVAMYRHGDVDFRRRLQAAKRQPLAAYAIQNGTFLEETMGLVTPWTGGYTRIAPRLTVMQHVPFDRRPDFPYGEAVPAQFLDRTRTAPLVATISQEESSDGIWILRGKLRAESGKIRELAAVEALVFLNSSGQVRGFGVLGFGRAGAIRATSIGRWQAIVHPAPGEVLELWVQPGPGRDLTLLPGIQFAPDPSKPTDS